MILNADEVRELYRRTAGFYDAALPLARLFGVRSHRRAVVTALNLQRGDTVVDLCCGTGANVPLLHDEVGAVGRIVGVDLTPAMLEKARARVTRTGIPNVELVESDVLDFDVPRSARAAVATFGLEMVPEYDTLLRHLARDLPTGSRVGLLGLKHPERWPEWLIDLGVWLNRPFGVSREYAEFRPWLSLRTHCAEVEHRELLGGAAYMSVGEVTGSG